LTLGKEIHTGVPNSQSISSLNNGKTINTSSFDFEDVITYADIGVPEYGNQYGIYTAEWRAVSGVPSLWSLPTHPIYTISHISAMISPVFNSNNKAQVEARLYNQCGWSDWKMIEYSGPSTKPLVCTLPCLCCVPLLPNCSFCLGVGCPLCRVVFFFSNPVSDELTIDFFSQNSDENSETETDQTEIIYSVKLLDNLGVTHRENKHKRRRGDRQKSSVKFDVSRLREGTYFLHIEANGEIHKEQIIIKRK
jgi:hypothetical protein